jgi:branched-subunit amino acid transport protein
MEIDDNNVPEEQGGEYVEIYSKTAIFWFSMLDPIFGGALLLINLNAAGYKKAFYTVLTGLILYTAAITYVENKLLLVYKIDLTTPNTNLIVFSLSFLVLKILTALVLCRVIFKRYFPDDDYYPKSVLSAMLVVFLVIMLLGYFGVGLM